MVIQMLGLMTQQYSTSMEICQIRGRRGMHDCPRLRSICVFFALLLLTACNNAPATLPPTNHYARIGVLPTYEPEILKRQPPGWLDGEIIDHIDLDLGVNKIVFNRIKKSLGLTHDVVDLQSFSGAYIGAPKVHSFGERKIIGDSRPLFTEVVKSTVGAQGLDAYLLVEGGPVRLYEPQVAPAIQMFAAQGHNLSIPLNIYIIDGHTFEVTAVSHASLVRQHVPDPWFVAPKQHAEEIKDVLVDLLGHDLEPALRKLGLI